MKNSRSTPASNPYAKCSFSSFEKAEARLFLVPVPIGNLEDVTARALRVLAAADIVACEDTRTTGELLARFDIKPKKLISCYSQTEQKTASLLLTRIQQENLSLAYCSDAGSPAISDPGALLVKEALKRGIAVVALPGPTAFVPALSASGFDTAHFTFIGFLPLKPTPRDDLLRELAKKRETLIFYEAPHRLKKTLAALLSAFGPSRGCCLARELTKKYEQYLRGSLSELQTLPDEVIRGEFVVVVEGRKEEVSLSDEEIEDLIEKLLTAGKTPSRASREIADLYGLSKNHVYRLAIQLSDKNNLKD